MIIKRIFSRLFGFFPVQLWKIAIILFPFLLHWQTRKKIDIEFRVKDYREELEEEIGSFSENYDDIYEQSSRAHQAEIARTARLDTKASNYLGNIGVVLSILSLAPILATLLAVDTTNIRMARWTTIIILTFFGFAVVMLLISAYYSIRTLKIEKYADYYTADGLLKTIKDEDETQDMIIGLLVSKKRNEQINLRKTNAIAVAESLSKNGLISLGIGILLLLVAQLPFQAVV